MSKAKTKMLSSSHNISAPPHTNTTTYPGNSQQLAVSQTLYVSNPSPAVLKSRPEYFSNIATTHFSNFYMSQEHSVKTL